MCFKANIPEWVACPSIGFVPSTFASNRAQATTRATSQLPNQSLKGILATGNVKLACGNHRIEFVADVAIDT